MYNYTSPVKNMDWPIKWTCRSSPLVTKNRVIMTDTARIYLFRYLRERSAERFRFTERSDSAQRGVLRRPASQNQCSPRHNNLRPLLIFSLRYARRRAKRYWWHFDRFIDLGMLIWIPGSEWLLRARLTRKEEPPNPSPSEPSWVYADEFRRMPGTRCNNAPTTNARLHACTRRSRVEFLCA